MMNVFGWRDAPPPSPFAAPSSDDGLDPLLRWLQNTQISPDASLDEAAQLLSEAWRVLLDAEAVALWVQQDGALARLAPTAEEESRVDLDGFDPSVWPEEPLFPVATEGAQRDLLTKTGMLSDEVALPSLAVPLSEMGLLLLWLRSSDGELDTRWQPILPVLGAQSGAILARVSRFERLATAFHELSQSIAAALDERERGASGFSRAVAYYASLIAREMKLDDSEAEHIEFAALWHGLGRLSVPDAVLSKTGPLEAKELEQVHAAAAWGARHLEQVRGLEPVAHLVRHSDERFDGSGAPDGLAGEAIPLGARVLAVARHFAAMTHERADRAPLSVVSGAMDTLSEQAGKGLDPRVVNSFMRAMGRAGATNLVGTDADISPDVSRGENDEFATEVSS